MPATNEPNLGLAHGWSHGEDGWDTGMEANLLLLGAVVQLAVAGIANAPTVTTDGTRYIVGTAPTGDFTGHAKAVAVRRDGAWVFLTPKAGWTARNLADGKVVAYDGSAWAEDASGGISDAPSDGTTYGRKNGAWAATGGGGGGGDVEEAPNDGALYARQNEGWTEITGGGGSAEPEVKSFRYWRVFFLTSSGGTYVSATEMQMRSLGVNLTTDSSKISAGSSYGGGDTSANLLDNDTGTFWGCAGGDVGGPSWVKYDFTTPVAIDEVLLTSNGYGGETPRTLKVQGSDDASTWETMFYGATPSWATNSQMTFKTQAGVNGAAPPRLDDFTPVLNTQAGSDGGTVFSSSPGGILIYQPARTAVADDTADLQQAFAPTGDWSVAAKVGIIGFAEGYDTYGIGVQDSAGKRVVFGLGTANRSFRFLRWDDINSFNHEDYGTFETHPLMFADVWLRLRVVGSTMYADFSQDGVHWINWFSEGKTAFLGGQPSKLFLTYTGNNQTKAKFAAFKQFLKTGV